MTAKFRFSRVAASIRIHGRQPAAGRRVGENLADRAER